MYFLKQKLAQNVAISLGFFNFSRNHDEPPKVAQLAKNHPIWSPWSIYKYKEPLQLFKSNLQNIQTDIVYKSL